MKGRSERGIIRSSRKLVPNTIQFILFYFSFVSKCSCTTHSHRLGLIVPILILGRMMMMVVVVVMMMILCGLQLSSKWRALRYMTILWENGLRGGVVEWLRSLKLRNIERVGWSKYGSWWGRNRVWVWLRRGHRSVVLEGGWHGRRWHGRVMEMRSAMLIRRIWWGNKELFYHPFVFFHVVIDC